MHDRLHGQTRKTSHNDIAWYAKKNLNDIISFFQTKPVKTLIVDPRGNIDY